MYFFEPITEQHTSRNFWNQLFEVFKTKMVFCYQNCSDLEKILKFEAEGQEFAKILGSLEQFIQTVKGQNNFW